MSCPRCRPRILLPDLRKNHCGAPVRLLIGPGVRKRALHPLEALDIRPQRLKFALPHNRHLKITHILPLTRARLPCLDTVSLSPRFLDDWFTRSAGVILLGSFCH